MKTTQRKTSNLKAQPQKTTGISRKDGYYQKIAPKAVSQARSDIATWKAALKQALSVDNPRRIKLQNLYKDVVYDALLTSQIENRKMQTLASAFSLKDLNGNPNDEAIALFKSSRFYYDLVRNILDSVFYGSTIVELINDASGLRVITIPRTNLDPVNGQLFYEENDSKGLDYRNAKEFGTWLYEFGNSSDLGLLNKAIPHILFKRFAQSCWSELCEIYGIPPRYMKTNTQDPVMLSRAEQMMRDMGAAAWFIIDETETFEFAKGAETNGDVYSNLIQLCNSETSLLISGAVIGQDTKHGNESKEKVSQGMLQRLVESDKGMVENIFNNILLPGLFKIGIIPDGLVFSFDPQEDIGELYTRTVGFLQYMDVDPEWVKSKFGIEVTGVRQSPQQAALSFFE